ncbi:MAG: alpha/beta fold hydrolase, partial [Allosphingosinicella sp.]
MTAPAEGPPDATSVLLPGPWTHRDISANGVRLHAAEAGQGPLVLLLHGFPQFWWAWRAELTGLAAAGFRVVAPDLRGYGASDKPPRGYDLPTLSADVAALVRALGEQDAVVVGHDWGGLLAWTTAALHPRSVRRLVVLSMAHPRRLRAAITDAGQRHALRHALGFQLP